MSISKELFFAILAMDAYNRGADRKVEVDGHSIGLTDITTDALDQDAIRRSDWAASGFSAVTYEIGGGVDGVGFGETAISYRGTDDFPDLMYGWTMGTGYPAAWQGELSIDVFEAVAGHGIYDENGAKPYVTGHSLGGGLSGFISLLSGAEGYGYDHMPFGAAAWLKFSGHVFEILLTDLILGKTTLTEAGKAVLQLAIDTARPQLDDLISQGLLAPFPDPVADALDGILGEDTLLRAISDKIFDPIQPDFDPLVGVIVDALDPVLDAATPDVIESWGIHVPDFGDFQGIAVDAEILQFLRDGTIPQLIGSAIQALTGALAPYTGAVGPFVIAVGNVAKSAADIIAAGITWAESQVDQTTLDTYGWTNFDPVMRHSIGLAAMLQYAEDRGSTHWQNPDIVDSFLWALFDSDTGKAAGADTASSVNGALKAGGDFATIQQIALAYSALDAGERPYGDAGIRALFNDLDDLGRMQSRPNHDPWLDQFDFEWRAITLGIPTLTLTTSISGILARIATQYAAALSIHGVNRSDVSDVTIAEGIIRLADDQKTMAADFSSVYWRDALNAGRTPYGAQTMEAKDADEILSRYFEQSTETDADLASLWFGGQMDESRLADLASWGWQSSDWHILDRIHIRTTAGVTEFALADRHYPVSALSGPFTHVDVFIATEGNDTVTGTSGNDLLLTENGDDIVTGGAGRDFILTGKGTDRIFDGLTMTRADGSAQNDDDIYVGEKIDLNPIEQFVAWVNSLLGTGFFTGDDVVEYSVADPSNPSAVAAQGVEVTDIKMGMLGDQEAVLFSVKDKNSGLVGTDTLVYIDRVVLSERADKIAVTPSMLDSPIWVDMGLGLDGGTFGKNDYDEISYLGAGQPIVTVNGATQAGNGDNGDLMSVSYLQLIAELVGTALDFPAPVTPIFAGVQSNDALRVTGFEKVTLTAADDVLWYGPIDDAVGFVTGWPAGDTYPAFGEIHGDAGNDVLVVRDARYVFAGEAIDPDDPQSPTAASDLRLEIHGEAGQDRIMVVGGTGAIVSGGEDRDFLFNWSYKGQMWGDGLDGTGGGDDIFWWSVGAFIMDAEPGDRLQMFGIPLTGGFSHSAAGDGQAIDWFLPWVRYAYTGADQLIVSWGDPTGVQDVLTTAMVVNSYDFGAVPDNPGFSNFSVMEPGDLGMTFRIYEDGGKEISLWAAMWGHLMSFIQALQIFAKTLHWDSSDDPLLIDLDGDGIETTQVDFGPHFDLDGDGFAQLTGWVAPDDGILVFDANGNGLIDDIGELFGGPDQSGYAELATFDTNADGMIDAADATYGTIRIWRDYDQDAVADAGELATLAASGIVSLSAAGSVIDLTAANGNRLVAEGIYTRADGSTGKVYEAIFDTNPVETRYLGDGGSADWASAIDSRGYGKLTQLSTAAANDFTVNASLAATAAAMTTPDMTLIRQQAQPVFEAWANALPDSRELAPVLVSADGALLDHGIYVEDASGGHWRLASGDDVLAGDGAVIARPTLAQVLAQAADAGALWRVDQMWSPANRTVDPQFRTEAPYLVTVSEGRATIVDYGVQVTDASGSYWTLASGQVITGADGHAIDRPQLADVLASAVDAGESWRTEEFAVAAAPFPFEKSAVYYKGGVLTDYAVQVTDTQGSFFVWSNNLRLALHYQDEHGINGFGLRNYALDLDDLRDADNTLDSYVRAEIVTAGQLKFAAAAYGIVFEPDVMMAAVDTNGLLQYSTPIDDTTAFLGDLMEHYSFFSRAASLHLAAQGGLAEFFRGIVYDAQADAWIPSSGRELATMFEAIFEHTPAGRDPGAAYMAKWGEIMNVIYPDLNTHSGGPKTQDFVFQMMLAAYENVPTDVELLKAAESFGIDEEAIVLHDAAATEVVGTDGDDLIRLGEGDQVYRGGLGHDVYVVGKNFGRDVIEDIEPALGPRDPDVLRFSHVKSTDVYAYKSGIDLVLEVIGTDDVLTIRNQFEGVLPGPFGGDFSPDTEMVQIVFADGVSWDELDIAWATSHPLDSDDLVMGTPDVDVLDGGRGNDILRGGRESDLYVFDVGYGLDRVEDRNDNILVQHYDIVQFGRGLDDDNLEFIRIADSNDLVVKLKDDAGVYTGDQLTVTNQFWAINTWVFGVQWLDRIERFVFGDGLFLSEADIMRRTLEDAKTAGDDAIFGFHNSDTLDGGAGSDFLSGGDENDTYVFARGYGHDVVEDNMVDFLTVSHDTLRIGAGITQSDIALERIGAEQTVTLVIAGTDDRITLVNEFRLTSTILFGDYYFDSVDTVRFFDGSTWDMVTMARMLLAQARTDGDDAIYGFDLNDTLDGGLGDDRLEGGSYSDTYVFRHGYGHDTIYDASTGFFLAPGWDTLDLQDIAFDDIAVSRFKEDLIFTVKATGESITLERQYNRFGDQENAIEVLRFADQEVSYLDLNPEDVDLVGTNGDDTLWGTHFAETIDGRAGDDLLLGSSDGDSYRFDAGYGNDTIVDLQETRAWFNDDHVLLGADITVDNIRFSKDGNDLVVTIADRADSLRIRDQFGNHLAGVEQFHFNDGTIWSITDVEELLLIAGGGRGDDVIVGLADNENILDGRQGDDQLFGGRAADTYLFGVGYGLDTITEVLNTQALAGAVDNVTFGALIDPEALLVRRSGEDLVLTLPESGDELRVVNGLDLRLVEEFRFADGTVWTLDDLKQAMLRGTDGDDLLIGFDDSADLMDGGRGSDEIEGGLQSDIYRFGIGDGDDAVNDAGGAADRVEFGDLITATMLRLAVDGNNLVIHLLGADDSLVLRGALQPGVAAHRIETFHFADGLVLTFDQLREILIQQQATAGDDIVTGFLDRNDVIAGGAGADELIGLAGADTYRLARGDGRDIVDDRGSSAGDRIVFDGYGADQALVRRAHPTSSDVVVSFAGASDEVLVKGALEASGSSTIESFAFADGTIWTIADLRARVLADAVTDGDDIVTGFSGADTIEPGRGNDIAYGQSGADTYVFTLGDGRDLIRDSGGSGDVDILKLEGYVPDDVKVVRPQPDRADLILVLGSTGDEILLRDQFTIPPGAGIEQVQFGDGTLWSRTDLVNRISMGGTSADEIITGGASAETLIGRGGADRLSGSDGSDTYLFTRGDGRDVIEDNGFGDTDVVRIGGYLPNEVRLARALDTPDLLVVRFAGSADELRIVNTLDSDTNDQIERIELDNGTVWSITDIKAMVVQPADPLADNELTGFDGADLMAGGLGNDRLSGAGGSDTYLYRRNDGDDVIEDNGFGSTDVVRLQGYVAAEVFVSTALEARDTLLLRFDGNGDQLRIVNTLDLDTGDQIERIELDGDAVWTMDTVRAILVVQQQTAQDDAIVGFDSADLIEGGTGDDSASGGDGSDTYVFTRGDGRDTIEDNGFGDNDVVRIHDYLPQEVSVAAAFEAADTLVLTFAGASDGIRIVNTLDLDTGDQIERIEFDNGTVWTMDTVRATLMAAQQTPLDDVVRGFETADALAGGTGDDMLHGGDGSDIYTFLRGDGRDTIEDNGAGDTDVVRLQGIAPAEVTLGRMLEAADTLVLRVAASGDVLTIVNTLDNDTGDQIERIEFSDGTVWSIADAKTMLASVPAVTPTVGTTAGETLDAIASAAILQGKGGSDNYVWARGDGETVVDDTGTFDGTADRVRLRNVDPTAVTLGRWGNAVVLNIADSVAGAGDGGRIVVLEVLAPSFERGIERIEFDDGTVWTPNTLRSMLVADAQTPGNDEIVGFTTAEVFEPGLGDDRIVGGSGSDTYTYTRGDGFDLIDESGSFDGPADKLFIHGVDVAAVTVTRSNGDVRLDIAESAPGAGDAGGIYIRETLNPSFERGIESIVFDDGTTWTPAELRTMLIAAGQSAGDDVIRGFTTADVFEGGLGDDVIVGDNQSDRYAWHRGDGSDVIDESSSFGGTADRLELHGVDPATVRVERSGNDTVLHIPESGPGAADGARIVVRESLNTSFELGVEQIAFDNGVVWGQADLRAHLLADAKTAEGTVITGFNTADVLEGGLGDDLLVGAGGSDVYVWHRGDGNDVVDESGTFEGAADELVLHGVAPGAASLQPGEGNDLVLVIAPSTPLADDGARIVIKNSASISYEQGLERIVFDDGTVWSRAEFAAQAIAQAASDSDDVITGSSSDDMILARAGNDFVHGADGSDTYVFRAGDGRDVIDDNGNGDTDVVEIRGYAATAARFTRVEPSSNDLLIRFEGSSDSITIVNGLAGTTADTVESFRFVDAASGATTATLTLADVSERLLIDARSDGDDQIVGTGAADVLGGGPGADVLDGAGDDDVYVFRSGDGVDRIADTGTTHGDVLSLPDFTPADLASIRRSPPAGLDLVLAFQSGDRAVLANSFSDLPEGVEIVRFGDGTEWSANELRQRVLNDAASDAAERLWGFSGDDRIAAAKGDDVMHGGDGSDTYVFAAGDGHDTIEDNGAGDLDRIEVTGYASGQVSVQRFYKGDDGIVLRFAASDDTLTVLNTLGGSAEDGIEQIVFADGIVWSMADVLAALDNDAPVAQRDGFFTAVQGRALTLQSAQLLVNDFDPNGDPLGIVAVAAPDHGSVQLNADGSIVYSAPADFTGVASFDYTVSDGRNGLATQTVTLRVRPPASAADDSGISTAEDTLLALRVERLLANDFDGDLMIVSQVLDAEHGTVSLASSGDITFVPDADYIGRASFRYVANTPEGGRAEATVSIDVTPVNDAPTAFDDHGLAMPEGTPLTISPAVLLANDRDIDGDTLSIVDVVGDAHVLASRNAAGNIVLSPVADFFGTAQITYTLSDGHGGSAVGHASIEVTPVNDAPVLQADALTTDEDAPLFFPVAQLLANDGDPEGDALTVTRVFGFDKGSAQLFPNGTILFRPNDDYYGQAGFSYEVTDGQGGVASARVDVQIDPSNDAPFARDESYDGAGVDWLSGTEDQALVIPVANLLQNDTDRDSLSISIASVSFGTHGTPRIVGDSVVFTPDAGYWGEASFSYVIADGDGGVDDGRVTLYFAPTSDAPPVAGDDHVTMFEDVTTVVPIAQLLANDADIDADTLTVLWISPFSVLDAANVDLARDAAGNLVIAPTANVNGRVTLVYEVSDGVNGSDIGTVSIDILAVNDDPEATDDTAVTSLDAPLVVRLSDLPLDDTDLDFDDAEEMLAALHVAGVQSASTGSLSIYGGEFAVLEVAEGTSGPVSFDYVLADEAGGTDIGKVFGSIAAERAAVITGSVRRDLLIGTSGTERIEGLAGSDDLYGRGGDDVLAGGDDADRLDGGEGRDAASYDGSNVGVRADLLARIGQGGHAQGDAYTSIEDLTGSAYADQLYGDGGANRLLGLGGHDLLDSRSGDDALDGGDGDDRLVGGLGADALVGGVGTDTADYSASASPVTVSLATGVGDDGEAEGDTLDGIENLVGSIGDDVLTGDANGNRLEGGRGTDQLTGGEGDDVLVGGRDADALAGGAGIDTADYVTSLGGVIVDLSGATAGGGDAEGDVYSGIENIRGSFHDDALAGDALDNRIEGGEGADRLKGGGGFDLADYHASASAVAVDLAAGTGSGGEAQGDTLEDIDGIVGSPWDDSLLGDDSANLFSGGFGRDFLAGAGGSDDYRFGFGGGDDTVEEAGSSVDIDRIVLDAVVPPSAVGLVRRGDDLVIELEQGEGFLTDTLTVRNHFLGESAGVERIVFGDGSEWTRAEIELRARAYSFQAEDDLIRFADEDQPYSIAALRLTANDADGPAADLAIVSITNSVRGTATLEADGSVTFLGAADFFGEAFFDYTVADGLGRESTATAKVVVRAVNDAPVADDDGVLDGPEDTVIVIPIASLLGNDADVDGDALRIAGFGPLIDETGAYLGEEADAGIAAAGTNGVVMFDLFGPNLLFIPFQDHYGAAGFSYQVSDGHGGTDTANVEIAISAVNDGPRPGEDGFVTRLGTTLVIDPASLTRNDREVEGDPVTVLRVMEAQHGAVSFDAAGRIVFVPEADFLGRASFSYVAGDGRNGEGTGLVTIDVIPLNDPPHAGNDRFDAVEDAPLVIQAAHLLGNDSDPNGDTLIVSRLDPYPEKGSVAFAPDGSIVFTPKANYNGDASFYYWVSDGRGGEARGTVNIEVAADNDEPFVNDDGEYYTVEDVPLDIAAFDLLANDGDPDGDVLTIGPVDVDHGSLVRVGRDLRFTPEPDFVGTVVATYRASDGKGGVSPTAAAFTIQVLGAADVPVAQNDAFSMRTGAVLDLAAQTLLANDKDGDGQPIRLVSVSDAVHGAVELLADGTVRFVPEAEYVGPASFRYTITDDVDGEATGQVDITVLTLTDNRLPEAGMDRVQTAEDTSVTVTVASLLANDTDADGDALSFVAIEVDGDNGRAVLLPGQRISLTPDDDFTGTVHFIYRISDGIGADVTGSIELDVAPVNDGPDAVDDFGYATLEDQTLAIPIAELLADDTDVEGDAFSLVSTRDAFNGTVVIDGDMLRFTPEPGYFGGAAFTYVVRDVHGAEGSAQVSISVTPANHPPTANVDTGFGFDEDGYIEIEIAALLANDTDPDGDILTFIGLGAVSGGTVGLLDADTVRFVGAHDFNGDASFDYRVVDAGGNEAQGRVDLTVRAVNDAPVARDDAGFVTAEDIPIVISVLQLLANDADVDRGSFQLVSVSTGSGGVPVLDGIGNVVFTPAADFNGTASFDYAIRDLFGLGDTARVEIAVTAVNDAPAAHPDNAAVARDDRLQIDAAELLANDTDAEGDVLLLLAAQSGTHGQVSLDAQGRAVYAPDEGYVGTDQFRYTITDGENVSEGVVEVEVFDPYVGWRQGTSGNDSMAAVLRSENKIYGAGGDDTINGGTRDDQLAGGRGNDAIVGLTGNDLLDGGDGNDTLSGGAGNDRFVGGRGDDTNMGGWGADTFVFRRGDGRDTIADFSPGAASGPNGLTGDRIDLAFDEIQQFNDVMQYARATATGIVFEFGEGDALHVNGAQLGSVSNDWFTFS